MEATLKRTIPQISLDSQALYERLKKTKVGDFIKYEELTAIISRDVTNGGRGCLATARNIAMREHRMVFACVSGEGIKRLADSEIVGIGLQATKHIRRVASKGMRKLSCVQDFDKLSQQEKLSHNTQMSVLGALHQACKESSVKRVESQVEKAQMKLSLAGTLDAFKK